MAKTYPKIKRVNLTNFMSIKSGSFEFDDSNMIRFVGYNDVGKSAIRTALECAMMYAYPTKQKKFINDDANFFQVNITFEDDVTISYERYASGKSVYELYVGTELQYTNKIKGNLYDKITRVPQPIADYLGLIDMPNGLSVNFGKRNDDLLLVGTSGSENYQALNTVLKSEEISRAVALLNKDNNAAKARLQNLNSESGIYMSNISLLKGVTPSLIEGVKSVNETMKDRERLFSGLQETSSVISDFNDIDYIPEIQKVDLSLFNLCDGILNSIVDYREVAGSVIPEVGTVDSRKLNKFYDIQNSIKTFQEMEDSIDPLDLVNKDLLAGLMSVRKTLSTFIEAQESEKTIASEYREVINSRSTLIDGLKSQGFIVTECQNCHELSIVDSNGNTVMGDSHVAH